MASIWRNFTYKLPRELVSSINTDFNAQDPEWPWSDISRFFAYGYHLCQAKLWNLKLSIVISSHGLCRARTRNIYGLRYPIDVKSLVLRLNRASSNRRANSLGMSCTPTIDTQLVGLSERLGAIFWVARSAEVWRDADIGGMLLFLVAPASFLA
jgi:hypothetical protein